jgi:crotonobetainyl-CoA:carnitine CoA-transferase CaiB-like acyl-CoA transferase
VIGRPDLAADPALTTLPGRMAAAGRVDEAISLWTMGRPAPEAVSALQSAGIPASVVMRPSLLMADDHLWARGFFHLLEREEIDPNFIPGAVVRLSATPGGPTRPAPLFGQHTRQVLGGLLGLDDAELDALESSGVTSPVPLPQAWR